MTIQIDHTRAREILYAESEQVDDYPDRREIKQEDEWKTRIDHLGELCPYRKSSTFIAALGTAILAKTTNTTVDVYCILERDGGEFSYSARSLADGVWAKHRPYLEIDLGANGANPLNNTPFVGRARIDDIENVRNKEGYAYLCECLDLLAEVDTEEAARAALRGFIRSRRARKAKSFEVGETAGDYLTASSLPPIIESFVNEDSEEGRRAQAAAAGLLAAAFGEDRVVVGHVNDPDRNFPLDVVVTCEPPEEGIQFGVEVKDKPVTGAELLRSINKAQAAGVRNIVFLAASSAQRDLDYSSEAEFARDMDCRLVCFFDWDAFSRMVFALSPAMGPELFSDVFKFIGKKLVEIGATQDAVDQWHEYSELPP